MGDDARASDAPSPLWAPWLGGALVVLLIVVSVARVGRFEVLGELERSLYDLATTRFIPAAPASGRVALVLVDDASLEALGERWPLERATWARFIAEIDRYQPKAIAVDAVFDQAAPRDALDLAEDMVDGLDAAELETSAAARELRTDLRLRLQTLDGDRQFVEAVAGQGRVVLGEYFVLEDEPGEGGSTARAIDRPGPQPLAQGAGARLRARQLVANIEPLHVAAAASGAINILHDRDGIVRRYPFAVSWEDRVFASLALATVRAATPETATRELITREALDGDRATPLLRFPAAQALPILRFADVLMDDDRSGTLGPLLAGRLVFVGVSATGLHDSHVRPGGERVPGVLLQAIAADNLLSGTTLESEGQAAWLGLVETALLLSLFLWGVRRQPSQARVLALGATATLVHAGLVMFALPSAGLWTGAAPGFVGLLCVTGAEIVGRAVGLQRQRRALLVRQRVVESVLRSREHIKLIVDNVADAILTVDDDHQIVSANGAASALFGLNAALSGLGRIGELLPGWPGTDAGVDPTGVIWECEGVRADGTTFAAEVITSRIPPQPEAGPLSASCISVVRDITARREADSAKQRFVSMVSHELRTPVTSIRGALGLVASGKLGAISPEAARMVDVAHSGSQRLVRLVNDILDVARIDAGALTVTPGPLDLGEVIAAAVAEAQGFAAEHGVTLQLVPCDRPLPVHGDRDRIAQVVANLVSNALKFSPVDAPVTVTVEHRQHGARVSVSDRGPGIPVEARGRIFERFGQAHVATARTRGTGLGLGIARSIVELHGGSIGFETAVGQGTTFWFDLPLDPPNSEEIPA